MSADNGIYILESKDGFRVIHTQAIESLWWWYGDERLYNGKWALEEQKRKGHNLYMDDGGQRDELNPRMLVAYFGKCEVYHTLEEVMVKAWDMYNDILNSEFPIIEYGISSIPGWEDKDFPEDQPLWKEERGCWDEEDENFPT